MTIPRLPVTLALAALCFFVSARADVAGQEPDDESTDVAVFGQVVDYESGDPVEGATVLLSEGAAGAPGQSSRVTGPAGRFRFEDVPRGAYGLTVSAPGYQELTDSLDVDQDGEMELLLPLSTEPIRLEAIVVTGRSTVPPPAYERRRRGGGAGFLITRADIEGERIRYLSELLHRVPGGLVVPAQPYGYALRLRAQCEPGIWMDGTPMPGIRSIDQIITPQDMAAIEVYHGFELPVEYGVNACGGILVWSRMGPTIDARRAGGQREPGSGFVANLVKVAAIVVVVILFTR